jgi:hypothetical protein
MCWKNRHEHRIAFIRLLCSSSVGPSCHPWASLIRNTPLFAKAYLTYPFRTVGFPVPDPAVGDGPRMAKQTHGYSAALQIAPRLLEPTYLGLLAKRAQSRREGIEHGEKSGVGCPGKGL